MKSECCHQHPDNGDLATQDPAQREETDLRAINADLLAALENIMKWDERPVLIPSHLSHAAVAAIDAAQGETQ